MIRSGTTHLYSEGQKTNIDIAAVRTSDRQYRFMSEELGCSLSHTFLHLSKRRWCFIGVSDYESYLCL
jgi:hypothetical protein